MDLRHLRSFIVLAEELHFSRAAERLHIEPSPLSRTIKELETELGIMLFKRNRRGTYLTHPGEVFLQEVRHVFATLENAKKSVMAAASGYRNTLRIALSDGAAQPHLATILARCREEEPDVEIRLTEVSLSAQLRGLRDNTFDAGFSRSAQVGDSVIARPVWHDSLAVAVPIRHPLLVHSAIPLGELLRYPLVLGHPETCAGYNHQLRQILRGGNAEPIVIEHVTSMDMMLTFVAAGYGLGFTTLSHTEIYKHPEIVSRPLAVENSLLTTYLLTSATASPQQLGGFIERIQEII
ncbi:LysR family transcriptional regulator [Pseudomonas sp. FME51]|uniref:LysR family transcriptional regulator n=1 Tax=Pseudomonas sp. FME51 TaxID=2742609 RepID=UPI00186815AF